MEKIILHFYYIQKKIFPLAKPKEIFFSQDYLLKVLGLSAVPPVLEIWMSDPRETTGRTRRMWSLLELLYEKNKRLPSRLALFTMRKPKSALGELQ